MNLIYSSEPKSWKELQILVANILDDCGCVSKIEETIDLVRGKKEIDVYVEDETVTPKSVYLCECKLWESKIPQETVHAFQTVVEGSGANHGFIISKIGFQSGAYSAQELSNISLLSWQEFQAEFYDRWVESMGKKITVIAKKNCRSFREGC